MKKKSIPTKKIFLNNNNNIYIFPPKNNSNEEKKKKKLYTWSKTILELKKNFPSWSKGSFKKNKKKASQKVM